jgi:succinate dehydrogenase / fumarate reductase, membrane anchor subunit
MTDNTLFGKIADCFSVKSPVAHWWYQRAAAATLLPLSIWLLVFLNKAVHASYVETVGWLSSPINALAIAAWTVAVIFHGALGVQVVIEDYVSNLPLRTRAIRTTNLIFLGLGIAALAAIIIILIQAR